MATEATPAQGLLRAGDTHESHVTVPQTFRPLTILHVLGDSVIDLRANTVTGCTLSSGESKPKKLFGFSHSLEVYHPQQVLL